MSKLSPSLKALINAPSARPNPIPAPARIKEIYTNISHDAAHRGLSTRAWLAISAAATFTLNSPASLSILHSVSPLDPTLSAGLIREVGLKCISFNGIPRSINCLNAFHAALPLAIRSSLPTHPLRTPSSVDDLASRGRALWSSVYGPLQGRLRDKLALAHPDLPGVILHGHYGLLLADPPGAMLGRAVTSLVAVACLRAQTGVAPQLVSHLFGLRRAVEEGGASPGTEAPRKEASRKEASHGDKVEEEDDMTIRWMARDEGSEWVLRTVDSISEVLSQEGQGASRRMGDS